MSLIVIGGHSRSVGKTSVVAGLISALPEFQWTALKITQYGHGICSASGKGGLLVRVDPQSRDAFLGEEHVEPADIGGRRMTGFIRVRQEGYRTEAGLKKWDGSRRLWRSGFCPIPADKSLPPTAAFSP